MSWFPCRFSMLSVPISLFCGTSVTPCAQWCVWMLFCDWSNQMNMLYRAVSDANCHPSLFLLLFVLAETRCVSKDLTFYFRNLWTVPLFVSHRSISLYPASLSRACKFMHWWFWPSFSDFTATPYQHRHVWFITTQTPVKRISKRSACYTECVIYENELFYLAQMVNFKKKSHSATQRPLGAAEHNNSRK